jgi:hypothetical protein
MAVSWMSQIEKNIILKKHNVPKAPIPLLTTAVELRNV